MKELIDAFINWVTTYLVTLGPLAGSFIIICESIFPFLPLCLFITLNIASYGMFFGFLISWISTVIGCMLSFYLVRKLFQKKLYNYIDKKKNKTVEDLMKKISNFSFSNIVVLVALPFTPASWINVAAGLSEIKPKKYLMAILVGKPAMVYFWGYIGTSLLESITDVTVIIKIALLLIGSFLVSRLVEKKFSISR